MGMWGVTPASASWVSSSLGLFVIMQAGSRQTEVGCDIYLENKSQRKAGWMKARRNKSEESMIS